MLAEQAVPGWTVTGVSITDATGTARRPGLRATWTGLLPDVTAIGWQVRVKARGLIVAGGGTSLVAEGAVLVSDGIRPATTYEMRGMLRAPRPVGWTDRIEATTPGGYLDAADMSPGYLGGVTDEINALLAPLRTGIDRDRPASRTQNDALKTISDTLIRLQGQVRDTATRITDAGVYLDPETGRATIYALVYAEEQLSLLAVDLDAAKAQLTLSVTMAQMNAAISAALLDPTQIPIIGDLVLQITDLSLTLDGLAGAITSKAETIDLDAAVLCLTTAETAIDSLNAAIVSKVDSTAFDALEARTTPAETIIAALDGASISQAVADTRALTRKADDQAAVTLAGLLADWQGRQVMREDIAFATQEIRAAVSADRVATASAFAQVGNPGHGGGGGGGGYCYDQRELRQPDGAGGGHEHRRADRGDQCSGRRLVAVPGQGRPVGVRGRFHRVFWARCRSPAI